MKKLASVLSVILAMAMMLVCFTACGNTGTDAPKTTDATNTTSTAKDANYIIYSDNSFAPFEYYDSAASAYVGIDMDVLAAIAADQNFTYELHNEGFDASMGAVQSGQADGMIAGMTINEERAKTYDFSEGYFENGQIMVVKSDSSIASLKDLAGKTVAAKTSTMGATYAESVAEEYDFTIVYYEDSPTMYTAVINGTNVACFEDSAVITWAIKSESLALKTVGDVINPANYGFAVKKGDNAALLEKFNAGLKNIKANGKYAEILAKYGY